MASWPSSTPRLKPTSASSSAPCGKPRSASTLAKPKPWISPKHEGHHPAPALDQRPQVVQRGQHHRGGDRRFDQRDGRLTHAQRRQRQRDRVRHRERGDDLHHVRERRRESSAPAASALRAPHQHRRQQQRQQEQDVVEADPDVPDAFAQVVDELRPAGWRAASSNRCWRRLRAEHRAARAGPGVRLQQAAVLRVDVGEQRVAERRAALAAPEGSAMASGSTV